MKRRNLLAAVGAASLTGFAPAAQAQAYPPEIAAIWRYIRAA